MKTYVISAKQGFGFNGTKIDSGDELAILTSNVAPENLFCWLQFGQAVAVMVKDAESEELPIADGESLLQEPEESDLELTEEGGGPISAEVDQEPPQSDSFSEDSSEVSQGGVDALASFLVDGLEEKIAASLAKQGLTPDEVRQMLADGFDLEEIDGIGPIRVEKIKAIYG